MAFLCLCPEKSLEFGADEKLHRSAKEQFIHGVLESINFDSKKLILTLPGGGIAVAHLQGEEPKIAMDTSSSTIAAMTGSIQNYAYLVKKYLQLELHLPPNVTLEAIRERTPVSETELLCRLYSQLGTGMLSKLRGHFSFCIYDSTTVRVLAGRDCSGSIPLVQGKLSDNSLFICSSDIYPADAHSVIDIPPGHFKYGWHAGAIKFANQEADVRNSAQEANSAAQAALAGLFCRPADRARKSGRSSLDSNYSGRPRKGIQVDHSRNGRNSIDSSNPAKKADSHDWWRSDSQKTSPKQSNRRTTKSKSSLRAQDDRTPAAFVEKLGGPIREDPSSVTMLMAPLDASPCSHIASDSKGGSVVLANKSSKKNTGRKIGQVLNTKKDSSKAQLNGSVAQLAGPRSLVRVMQEGHSRNAHENKSKKTELSIGAMHTSNGKVPDRALIRTLQTEATSQQHRDDKQNLILSRSKSCGDMASVVGASVQTVQ